MMPDTAIQLSNSDSSHRFSPAGLPDHSILNMLGKLPKIFVLSNLFKILQNIG
jgi:hypothetical protein